MIKEPQTIYRSPRYDINGFPTRPYTVTDQNEHRYPREYLTTPQVKTRTELLQKRKKELIPDISYDIDGDGYVGHNDMVIAKIFDKNNDGILDPSEKQEMQNAINAGLMDKYVWGLDKIGVREHTRTIQKQGKILKEGFYDNSKKPETKTLNTIKQLAKNEMRAKAIELSDRYFNNNPSKLEYIQSASYNTGTKHKTPGEKKDEIKKLARQKIGLSEPTDIKDYSKEPKYEYVQTPQISGFTDFKLARKQKMVRIK
jgi:hypothetical protein